MLDVEVVPGESLGDFRIGMPISAAIALIQRNYKDIPAVELKYCEEDLLSTYIIIHLVEEGIILRFEPRTQRLHTIEVYDLSKVILRYSNVAFSGGSLNPTFVLIYSRFGPSFPGDFEPEKHVYYLHYPGVSFTFPIPPQFDCPEELDLPLEFEDGTSPVTSTMRIYYGDQKNPSLPPLVKMKNHYFEEVHVTVGKKLEFKGRRCVLDFHATSQDVVSELGRPERIFYKHEDKMRIHSGDRSLHGTVCEDYFYNYFSLGIDVLFDMQTHCVKKFVLHTNFPCHPDFNLYSKCNFRIFFDGEDSGTSSSTQQQQETRVSSSPISSSPPQQIEQMMESVNLVDNEKEEHSPPRSEKNPQKKEPQGAEIDDGQSSAQRRGHNKTKIKKKQDKGKDKVKEGEQDEQSEVAKEEQEAEPREAYTTRTVSECPSSPVIHPDMKWQEILRVLPGPPQGKPVVHNVGSNANPFGSTLFFGHKDVIFEVMRNQHIASVCLFSSGPQ